MHTYLCVYLGAALLALLGTPVVIWLARRIGALDYPCVRSVHQRSVPRIGGVAIFLSSICMILSPLCVHNDIGEAFRDIRPQVLTLLGSAAFVFGIGLLDDLMCLPARFKFLAQLAAAGSLCFVGVRIDHIGIVEGHAIALGWLSCPLTLLWIVGITNAVNFSDGLDGLAAGISAITCGVIAVLAIQSHNAIMAIFALALVGSLTGFLVFNFHPAKIFMGDCGSLFLGFTIAASSVMCMMKSSAIVGLTLPALTLGIPIFDTLFCMLRRYLERRSLFAPDRGHFHHRLLDLGLHQRHAVILIYLFTLLCAGLGLLMMAQREKMTSLAIFGGVLLLLLVPFRVVGGIRPQGDPHPAAGKISVLATGTGSEAGLRERPTALSAGARRGAMVAGGRRGRRPMGFAGSGLRRRAATVAARRNSGRRPSRRWTCPAFCRSRLRLAMGGKRAAGRNWKSPSGSTDRWRTPATAPASLDDSWTAPERPVSRTLRWRRFVSTEELTARNGRKRLLLISQYFPVERGGAEYQMYCLAQSLQAKMDVHYLTVSDAGRSWRDGPITIWSIPRRKLLRRVLGRCYVLDHFRVWAALRRIAPDIIYVRHATAHLGTAAWYAQSSRCPLIWHIPLSNDVERFRLPSLGALRTVLFDYLDKKMIDYGIRHASRIIGQAKYEENLLQQNYGRTCDLIVGNWHPEPTQSCVKGQPVKVVWVANLKPAKRPEVFVDLAESLGTGAGVEFLMVGRPDCRRQQRRLAARFRHVKGLTYLGERSIDEINRLLAQSHIFVNTSRSEGFPNTFVQAWLREVPVVSLHVDPDDILKTQGLGFHSGTFARLVQDTKKLIEDPGVATADGPSGPGVRQGTPLVD